MRHRQLDTVPQQLKVPGLLSSRGRTEPGLLCPRYCFNGLKLNNDTRPLVSLPSHTYPAVMKLPGSIWFFRFLCVFWNKLPKVHKPSHCKLDLDWFNATIVLGCLSYWFWIFSFINIDLYVLGYAFRIFSIKVLAPSDLFLSFYYCAANIDYFFL